MTTPANTATIPDGSPVAMPTYPVDPTGNVVYAQAVGTALAAFSGNPAQTAAAGADTLYKFGGGGTTSFNHCAIQNNTTANVFYAFDQSSVTAANAIYVLASGQTVFWDRKGTTLHFSSAAQQNFGGQSGITVEAFA